MTAPLAPSPSCFVRTLRPVQTLSSLSLVFALHHYRPNPLYVMDEIDAALDFRNVRSARHLIHRGALLS